MSEADRMQIEEGGEPGNRRRRDRRRGDRRRELRGTPPPPVWRRPAAYIGYGVVSALLAVLVLRGVSGEGAVASPEVEMEALGMNDGRARPAAGPAREAYSLAEYEQLLAEGEEALGTVVRAELYCGSVIAIAVRDAGRTAPALLELADGDGRVAAAECRWGTEARTSDFLLVVPSTLAEDFARAPEVEVSFVRRRRVVAELEWLGRSEALGVRNSGILLRMQ